EWSSAAPASSSSHRLAMARFLGPELAALKANIQHAATYFRPDQPDLCQRLLDVEPLRFYSLDGVRRRGVAVPRILELALADRDRHPGMRFGFPVSVGR